MTFNSRQHALHHLRVRGYVVAARGVHGVPDGALFLLPRWSGWGASTAAIDYLNRVTGGAFKPTHGRLGEHLGWLVVI